MSSILRIVLSQLFPVSIILPPREFDITDLLKSLAVVVVLEIVPSVEFPVLAKLPPELTPIASKVTSLRHLS